MATRSLLWRGAVLCSLAAPCPDILALNEMELTRGELLYSTHCIACHTEQVHWRDQRLATDWDSLARQVRRWQENARLNWSEEDVAAVAQHLNRLFYHFPSGRQEAMYPVPEKAR
jgi:mono/diheme cytochrome c family protein